MEDDMPVLIDTVEVAKKSTKVDFDFNKKEEDFKEVMTKKKRREKNKASAAMVASTSMGEDIEEEDEDEMDDEDEETINTIAEFERKANEANASRKFNFPQLTGDKLMVCLNLTETSCLSMF